MISGGLDSKNSHTLNVCAVSRTPPELVTNVSVNYLCVKNLTENCEQRAYGCGI